jgi:protein gp37
VAEKTEIAWCDSTFNPWIGCTKVGPGCDNCYAKADFEDRKHRVTWGAGQARSRTAPANWKKPLQWNAQKFVQCDGCGWRGEKKSRHACPVCGGGTCTPARRRVFCASLADVFDNEVDPQWRADLFKLIVDTPNLDWLVLTKRIGNVARMIPFGWQDFGMPANLWLGATIVNQEEADRDIPKLLATPAAVRFLSMEPLLGPVDLHQYVILQCDRGSIPGPGGVGGVTCPHCKGASLLGCALLNWVIAGGESGPNARPMHPDWARSLRDQCDAAGVPFLFKQWGEWGDEDDLFERADLTRCAMHDWGDRYFSPRVGKKAAGRRLDGVEHNGFPRG